MNEMLSSLSLPEFTSRLASKAPVPGGGGAAALTAANAAALVAMAGSLTVGKKKYAAVREQLQQNIGQCEALREHFLSLIDADAEAFLPLQQAYSIPKDDPARAEVMQQASLTAASAPLQMLRALSQLLPLAEQMAQLCSPLVVSDVGCAASLCAAAAQSAAINVFVNTSGLAAAQSLETEAKQLLADCENRASALTQAVLRRFQKEEN